MNIIKKLMFCLIFLVLASPVLAKDLNLAWDASDNAEGYKIYQSTDLGVTWDAGTDVGNVTTFLYPNVPDTGLVIFRISAYNSQVEIFTYESGVFYNGDWVPPDRTSGLGIK